MNQNNWKQTTLGEVVVIRQGKYIPEEMLALQKSGDFKYPVFGGGGIRGFAKSFEYESCQPIITCRGSGCGLIQLTDPCSSITNSSIAFESKGSLLDMSFVYYWALSQKFNDVISGSAQPQITIGALSTKLIQFPDIQEQKSIAAVLSSFDDKIELLRAQNKTLEEIAQRLFKEWFVDFNFPNEDGKPYKKSGGKMVDSEKGEIPEGWAVGKLGDEVNIIMGQSPVGESYNNRGEGVIFFQGRTDFGERFPKIRLYTSEPKRMAKKFDVLVSVRAPVGDINLASEDCCIGRGLTAVSSECKSYALYKIKSLKDIFEQFESEGTVFGSINKDSFSNIEVLIPKMNLVKDFDKTTKQIDGKIFNNHIQIQALATLRDTLLPRLMVGELEVQF